MTIKVTNPDGESHADFKRIIDKIINQHMPIISSAHNDMIADYVREIQHTKLKGSTDAAFMSGTLSLNVSLAANVFKWTYAAIPEFIPDDSQLYAAQATREQFIEAVNGEHEKGMAIIAELDGKRPHSANLKDMAKVMRELYDAGKRGEELYNALISDPRVSERLVQSLKDNRKDSMRMIDRTINELIRQKARD